MEKAYHGRFDLIERLTITIDTALAQNHGLR